MNRRAATAEEARALAHPLRMRILRLCLDQALTNKELAERLGEHPATVLHHVRTLERTGFLAAEPERAGPRGSTQKPYRSTGKSWTLDVSESSVEAGSMLVAMIDAFRAEVLEAPPDSAVNSTRMALRLRPEDRADLAERAHALVVEYIDRQDPDGEPIGLLFAIHRRVLRPGEAPLPTIPRVDPPANPPTPGDAEPAGTP